MSGLRFEFQRMIDEISAIEVLASGFLEPESRTVLSEYKKFLDTYRKEPTEGVQDYEKGNRAGRHQVFGEISSAWEIRRIAVKKKKSPAKYFELCGLASTKVRVMAAGAGNVPPQELAMWRMEIGDAHSPGCHFHVQVLGETSQLPFPKSLPVPRIPSLMMTPAAVIEFVLAELFQDKWERHVVRNATDLRRWSSIQSERWLNLLRWKIDLVKDESNSPWTAIKMAKPQPNLFVFE